MLRPGSRVRIAWGVNEGKVGTLLRLYSHVSEWDPAWIIELDEAPVAWTALYLDGRPSQRVYCTEMALEVVP